MTRALRRLGVASAARDYISDYTSAAYALVCATGLAMDPEDIARQWREATYKRSEWPRRLQPGDSPRFPSKTSIASAVNHQLEIHMPHVPPRGRPVVDDLDRAAEDIDQDIDPDGLMPMIQRAHETFHKLELSLGELKSVLSPILAPWEIDRDRDDDDVEDGDARKKRERSPASDELAALIWRMEGAEALLGLIMQQARP